MSASDFKVLNNFVVTITYHSLIDFWSQIGQLYVNIYNLD